MSEYCESASTDESRVKANGPISEFRTPDRLMSRHQGESYIRIILAVNPKCVLEAIAVLCAGRGGENVKSLYKGVDTDRITRLLVYTSPAVEMTAQDVGVCVIEATGVES